MRRLTRPVACRERGPKDHLKGEGAVLRGAAVPHCLVGGTDCEHLLLFPLTVMPLTVRALAFSSQEGKEPDYTPLIVSSFAFPRSERADHPSQSKLLILRHKTGLGC